MPRATTAAWEVIPPRAVRMPWAAFMPRISSGLVSIRTRITLFALRLAHFLGLGREEDDPAHRRARGGGQPLGQNLARVDRAASRAAASKAGWRSMSS